MLHSIINYLLKNEDKSLHLYCISYIGILTYTVCYLFVYNSWICQGAANITMIIFGIGKELYDKYVQHTYIDVYDLLWDLIGQLAINIPMTILSIR